MKRLKVLRLPGIFDVEPARCCVDRRVPWWLEQVTVSEPLEKFDRRCDTYGSWYVAFDILLKESDRRAPREFDFTPVHLDLGGGRVETRRDSWRAEIGTSSPHSLPVRGRVRFEALDALPDLIELAYTGRDSGFIDYVVQRRIESVIWREHRRRRIDLRESRVERLSLEVGEDPVRLLAPPSLSELAVFGRADRLTVEGANASFPFKLEIHSPDITEPPRGLERVQRVQCVGLIDADTSALASYRDLAELFLWGAPGRIRDACGLASLTHLRELATYELYSLDASRWPSDWPRLDGVVFHGLRKADAVALKQSLATVPDVRITSVRSDGWIEANLENPFRGWDRDGSAFGRAACAAWRTAKTSAIKLGDRPRKAKAKGVLDALVVALNRLHAKYDIETLRREEAGEAFFALARQLGIGEETASEWFDDLRDF